MTEHSTHNAGPVTDRGTDAANEALWARTAGDPIAAPMLQESVRCDLVVVGGGFTGCAAALAGAELGASVRVLESRSIGYGGSGRNVGLTNAGLWLAPDNVEAALGETAGQRLNAMLAAAPARVFALVDRYGIACEATRAGTLHCAHSAGGLAELEARAAQFLARGAPVEMLDAVETQRRTASERYCGALFDPRAGTVQPLAYVRGLARAAAGLGAMIHENSPAEAIEQASDGWRVRTSQGEVHARRLILATNAYHAGLPDAAAPRFSTVHYFQLATPPLPPDALARLLPGREGCWDTATVMSSFRLDAAGRLVVGSIGTLNARWSGIHTGWAQRKVAQLFPWLAATGFEHAWHGRIAMTDDHLPRITRLGPGGLAPYGYSGRGIGPGTVFGMAAARCVLQDDESVLPVPICDPRSETMTTLREAVAEAGASAFHLSDSR